MLGEGFAAPVPRRWLCQELGLPSGVALTNWAVPRLGI